MNDLIHCTRCARLVACREAAARKPASGFTAADYWSKPVPGFGDPLARLIILGLAPGAHGANRSGRPFTGDAAGTWLYPALYHAGFSNQAESTRRGDGLALKDAFITNVVKCVPPGNKPLPVEEAACAPFLEADFKNLPRAKVILTLGGVALRGYLRWAKARGTVKSVGAFGFSHGGEARVENGHTILMSYHCSRLNTNTGRLTKPMFDRIFDRARKLVGG